MKAFLKSEAILLTLFVGLLLCWTIGPTYRRKKAERYQAQELPRVNMIISSWATNTFTCVESETFSRKLSELIFSHSNDDLEPDRAKALKATLTDHFSYFLNPKYEQFMYCRTNGATFNLSIRGATEKLLRKLNTQPLNQSSNVESQIASAWLSLTEHNQKMGVNSMDAVAMNQLSLQVLRVTNSSLGEIQAQAKNQCTFVTRSLNSGILQKDNPLLPINRGKSTLVAVLSYLGHFSPSNRLSPFYAVFFWSEGDRKWQPGVLFFDMQTRYATLF